MSTDREVLHLSCLRTPGYSDLTRHAQWTSEPMTNDPTRPGPTPYIYVLHTYLIGLMKVPSQCWTGGIDTVLSNVIQLPAPSQIPQDMNARHGIACNNFCGNYPTAWSGQCLELSCWLDKVDKVGLQHPTSGTRHRLWLSDWLWLWYIIYYISYII